MLNMSLIDQLKSDLNTALKAGDELKLSTLRLLVSAVKNKSIELKRDLPDDEVIKIISSQAKQRQDSIVAYNRANRPELSKKEQDEFEILKEYLPEPISETEITAAVEEVISEMNATKSDFGKVMGASIKKLGGYASGQEVSKIVNKLLQE